MRYISRSSFDTFSECPRKGYWRYLSGPFDPTSPGGLEEPRGSWHLDFGIAWHAGAEQLLRGEGWEAALEAARPSLSGLEEPAQNLVLALFQAWERAKRDDFFSRFEVLEIEKEFEIPISPNVVLYTRADAILRERADGSVWVLNWKTTSDTKDWTRKWFFDPQGWTEAIAAESALGLPVAGTLYFGVWKGPIYQGKTSSRLIYGYRHTSKQGMVTWATENGGGGQRFEVWKERFPFGDGLSAWIGWLHPDFLAKHFLESAPQLRQDALVESWLRQVVRQENDIDHALGFPPEEREEFFLQRWGDLNCGRCSFKDLCLRRARPEELIAEGLLSPRKASPRDEAAFRRELSND